ncbi:HD domain-containing protein [Geomonas sp. Red32]|uniref:HD-GYP domain-containing protein n=1 Tax=Geomonas sp. Red32 TaxID=2912856 RepID=UPI00202CFE3A|nr:HD domain-containing phosphohydrolase [Geomonas sp. Red32]MCM0082769.1 HD domain-containing protein [Geomonas sp. Red32]
MGEMYVPVNIESIQPEVFPDVALYIRSGDKYILYKSHGRNFTQQDATRLLGNNVEVLFVSPEDLEAITTYMETNAERVLQDDTLQAATKGKIIYQTSINFVGDLFEHPEKVSDFNRSKRLVENLLQYLSSDPACLNSLENVMSHNYYTFVHSLQVAALSVLLHREAYLLSHDEMIDVAIGTLLHDFGKIFVSQEILNKEGKLTPAEMEAYRKHPEDGYLYLKANTKISDISLGIVRYHHERNNGKGYPQGLKGPAIARSAQAAAICDVYCTLTIDRTCRKALSSSIAVGLMKQEMKEAFNEKLLDVLEGIVCADNPAQFL